MRQHRFSEPCCDAAAFFLRSHRLTRSPANRRCAELHPDKQTDATEEEREQAAERFKAVNEAYSLLSDPKRREKYDKFGIEDEEEEVPTSGGGGRGRNRRKGGRAEEDEYEVHEVSIEEIIAATLDLRKRRYSLLSEEPILLFLVQICLPIAIALTVVLSQPVSTPAAYAGHAAPFKPQADGEYTLERKTAASGVSYFVRPDFESALGGDKFAVAQVEAAAESLRRKSVRAECDGQRRRWQNLVNSARRSGPKGPERDAKVKAAEARPTPACAELRDRYAEDRAVADAFKKRDEGWGAGTAWQISEAPPATKLPTVEVHNQFATKLPTEQAAAAAA